MANKKTVGCVNFVTDSLMSKKWLMQERIDFGASSFLFDLPLGLDQLSVMDYWSDRLACAVTELSVHY